MPGAGGSSTPLNLNVSQASLNTP